jgi:hypothetical protein
MSDEHDEVQSDAISERMAKVIDETESRHSETVSPHWEVVDHDDGEPSIYHLHDGEQVAASLEARDDGERIAVCSQCSSEIDLGGRARDPALNRSS